jgi:hypothetical protein
MKKFIKKQNTIGIYYQKAFTGTEEECLNNLLQLYRKASFQLASCYPEK